MQIQKNVMFTDRIVDKNQRTITKALALVPAQTSPTAHRACSVLVSHLDRRIDGRALGVRAHIARIRRRHARQRAVAAHQRARVPELARLRDRVLLPGAHLGAVRVPAWFG